MVIRPVISSVIRPVIHPVIGSVIGQGGGEELSLPSGALFDHDASILESLTFNDSTISSIANTLNSSYAATQSEGSRQPILSTLSNSKPAIDWQIGETSIIDDSLTEEISEFTVAMVFSASTFNQLFTRWDFDEGERQFSLRLRPSPDRLQFTISTTGSNSILLGSVNDIVTDTPYVLVAQVSGTNWRMVIDGLGDISGSVATPMFNTTARAIQYAARFPTGDTSNCKVSQSRFWKRYLTAEEVTQTINFLKAKWIT